MTRILGALLVVILVCANVAAATAELRPAPAGHAAMHHGPDDRAGACPGDSCEGLGVAGTCCPAASSACSSPMARADEGEPLVFLPVADAFFQQRAPLLLGAGPEAEVPPPRV